LDTKIHEEKDLRKLDSPYLGDIPLNRNKKGLYIQDGDDSNIAEAFRYVRTNINFMLDSKQMGKTILVTSSQSGEGKTFTAINLSNSLAISGKKTLLLGLDLRAPKMVKYMNIEGTKIGVTNFIKDEGLTLDDIINRDEKLENLDYINSGDIPPNPVELLMSRRVKELFQEIKEKYEYIIIDTAPVGMVTDTLQVANLADLTIFVIKANSLDKRMLHIPYKLNREQKLPNMALLLNGTDHSPGAYGYGYGYRYGGNAKKNWYEQIFKL
jgi:capsular exopolysaccharide synthesis family protein